MQQIRVVGMDAKQVQIKKRKEAAIIEDSPDELWDEENAEKEEE
ncbi:MAG: hypothetical protein V1835_01445 [Candidatus Micrarchaeota archaeon]